MRQRFFFRYRWLLAFAVATVLSGIVLPWENGKELPDRGALVAGIWTIAIGFCFFYQKQTLAEAILFKQLFTEFNKRFDRLSGSLKEIAASADQPTPALRQVILKYFDLCAEEYLFRCEGYIPDEVWRAWCRGMRWHIERGPFKTIWDKEDKDCYYGLTTEIIRKGAEAPNP